MPSRLLAAALVALALAGCGGNDPAAGPTTPTPDPSLSSATAGGQAVSGTSSTAPPPPEPTGASDALADGRHAGYLKGVDADKRTVVVDIIQFLTGAPAAQAAAADGRGTDVPNDYYIRNVNPRLRTLALVDSVDVTVLDPVDPARSIAADVAGLATRVAHDVKGGSTEATPYWLTVSGGRVTKVEQQYLP